MVSRSNFGPRDYTDIRGKTQPLVELTKDGMMFLIMGFTGKKADMVTEAYIEEVNRRGEIIQRD